MTHLRTALSLTLTLIFSSSAIASELVIALKPDKNPDAMVAERTALAAALKPLVGQDVRVIVPLSDAVITEGLTNGSIDAGWLSATDVAKTAAPRPMRVLLASQVKGRTTYDSIWLVRSDAPFQSIADLRGKPVAFAKKTSTSGGVVPLNDLVVRGLVERGGSPEAFFGQGNVWFGSGYVSAVERVLAGEADAAAVSDYVFEGDKHLSAEQKAKLRVLQRQGPVPTHVLAVRTTLDQAAADTLKSALITLGERDQRLRDTVFTGPLVSVVEDEHLAPISQALATVKALKL
jgi:phosphonate transport system substrate-binding protein